MSLAWLFDLLDSWPDRTAVIWNDQPTSYRDLVEHVDAARRYLDDEGVQNGAVVALQADFSPVAIALMLALIERAAILVPLSQASLPQAEEFLRTAEVQAVIRVDAEDRWNLTWRGGEVGNPLTRGLVISGDPGLVLFTSGSTGTSKAALHNFASLLEKFKVRRHRLTVMTFLLLDHIGGINTLFYALSNGGTVVSIRTRDPDVVCRAIERHQVELLPTTPTFLNLLLISEAYRRHDLSSLRRISYGTEVMPETTLRRLREVLPDTDLLQTYGLTEVGILRSKSKDPDSLYLRVGGEGFETKVVDGVLFIRARSAMLGYLNAPSPFDADGWFNTQDAVSVEEGHIRILGRRSEIINVGGQKVYPAEVESVLLKMSNVRDVEVHGEPNPIAGNIVAARFNLVAPEDLAALKKRVRAFCRDRLEPFKIPVRIEISDSEQYSGRYKKMRSLPS